MSRRQTHEKGARTKMVCIRMTEDDYALKARQARELGLTPSGLCERLVLRLVLKGKVELGARPSYKAMDPALFMELRRIGNNVNQIAHAVNAHHEAGPAAAKGRGRPDQGAPNLGAGGEDRQKAGL